MASKRVLVVDENAIARLATAEALTIHGLEAAQVSPGAFTDGNHFGGPPPDLVVVGVSLPDVDGIALARRVAERLPGVPLLLFAVEPQSLRLPEFAALGVAGLLSKNILPSGLRRAVCILLGLPGARS